MVASLCSGATVLDDAAVDSVAGASGVFEWDMYEGQVEADAPGDCSKRSCWALHHEVCVHALRLYKA